MSDIPTSRFEFANETVSDESLFGSLEDRTRANLNILDRLLMSDSYHDYEKEEIEQARACVSMTMESLREHPELDSILIDADVRNVIRFIRLTQEKFTVSLKVKEKKAEKQAKSMRSMKNPSVASITAAMQADMKAAMGGLKGDTTHGVSAPTSVESFARQISGGGESHDPIGKAIKASQPAQSAQPTQSAAPAPTAPKLSESGVERARMALAAIAAKNLKNQKGGK